MSDVENTVKTAEVAVETEAKSVRQKVVAFAKANVKTVVAAVVGLAVGHFVK